MLASDFGDAPFPYPTTLAEGGAEHVLVAGGPRLGSANDAEADGTHAAAADADGADDGVTFGTIQVGALGAMVTVNAGDVPGKLDAWIDFNRDGNWGGPGEQIFASRNLLPGNNDLDFDVPSHAMAGITYARFRVSTAGALGVGGAAPDGEVEDYEVPIVSPSVSAGVFGARNTIATEVFSSTSAVAVDIDGDGDLDVLAAPDSGFTIAWFENDGERNFMSRTVSGEVAEAVDLLAADIDGDGDLDVLSASFYDNKITWYENDGSQVFAPHPVGTFPQTVSAVSAADIDGDGDLDIIAASYYHNEISWYMNDGNQSFSRRTFSASSNGVDELSTADVDGDGDLDVLSASFDSDAIVWHENDGSQNFSAHTISAEVDGVVAVLAADMDGDGDLDVLSASALDDKFAWFENDGNEGFTQHAISTTADRARSLYPADLDGDGDLDVLATSYSDDVIAWYENDGSQNFTDRTIATDGKRVRNLIAADVDGDGDLDVLTSFLTGGEIAWYENINQAYDFTAPTFAGAETDGSAITDVVMVTRSGQTDIASTVDVVLTGESAVSGSDFTPGPITVHFGIGDTTKPVPIEILGDVVAELDESIELSLANFSPGSGPGGQQPTATYVIENDDLAAEFGDAPIPYPTTLAEDGARHGATGLQLGALRDVETDGPQSVAADADGDEDGVALGTIRVGALAATATVNVQGAAGKLDAWIDFNRDGSWGGPGERIFTSRDVDIGENLLSFNVPSFATQGTTYARFRVSTAGALGVTGFAADGEVEDYQVTIFGPSAASGVFGEQIAISTQDRRPTSVVAADFDGDGDLDLLSTSNNNQGSNPTKIAWYENNGNQVFTSQTISERSASANDAFTADLDGDGDLDILTASSAYDGIGWHNNDSSQNFYRNSIDRTVDGASVIAVDVDDDGDLDVLAALNADNEIAWYENDGIARFTSHTVSTTALGASSVFAADIDGDGDLDFLSASEGDDKVAWYENDGSQNFLTHVISTEAVAARSVYAADVDGDGDLDVLSASYGDDKIAWYENDGGQSFTARTISIDADGAQRVFAADINGDGRLDVLSASSNDNKIAWYENDGSENFTPRTITTAANGARSVLAADVDGDGDLDVVSASADDDKIAWYENLNQAYDFTASEFRAAETDAAITPNAVMLTRSGPLDVAARVDVVLTGGTAAAGNDFTGGPVTVNFGVGEATKPAPIEILGDTHFEVDETIILSLAIVSPGDGTGRTHPTAIYTIEDDDPGDFGDAPFPYPTTRAENGARHAPVGPMLGQARDVESDGAHSPAADGEGAEDDGVTFGTMRVGALAASITVNVGGAAAKLDAWIDFNGDGSWGGPGEQVFASREVALGDNQLTLDVPSHAAEGTTYARFRVSAAGALGPAGLATDGEVEDYQVSIVRPTAAEGVFRGPHAIVESVRGVQPVVAADVDGDGDLDLLSPTDAGSAIVWYENDGSQGFTARAVSPSALRAYNITAADVDGDGDLDVLSASNVDDTIAWYENDGSQNFSARTISTTAVGAQSVYAADFDDDGDLDVLSASFGDDKIAWYENDGNQNFAVHAISATADGALHVVAADVDGDGDLDVLSASILDDKIAWYENDGNENFTPRIITTAADAANVVAAADVDGDGDLDVLSASTGDDTIAWYENDGNQSFTSHVISDTAIRANTLFAADIDGDGDLDVLGTSGNSYYDRGIAWYENDGSQNFTARKVHANGRGLANVLAADIDGDGDLDALSSSL